MTNPEAPTVVKHNQSVVIELPNGSKEKIVVLDKWTVRDFKVNLELQFGIPYNLQKVCLKADSSLELNDWLFLHEAVQTFEEVIVIQVPVWWNKFICASLNNEIENVYRRTKLPMQQITKEERLFVGFFIACCRGFVGLLEKLKTLEIQHNSHATTEAGRNLFHAAAVSGKANCVEFVASHLVDPTKDILAVLDTNKETPLDIARRFKHHETERVLYKYMYQEKGEREERKSAESGIDLSEEFESTDLEGSSLDGVNQERKSQTRSKRQAPGNDSSEEEILSEHDEDVELVITECDEGLSIVGASTEEVEPPPNELKVEASVIVQNGDADDVSPSNSYNLQVRAPSDPSSESSEEPSSPQPSRPRSLKLASGQPLLQRRCVKGFDLYRPKSARPGLVLHPKISVYEEEEEEEIVEDKDTHLPPLEGQTPAGSTAQGVQLLRTAKKQAVVRTNSGPNSPAFKRLSPEEDRSLNSLQQPTNDLAPKSAPSSPQSPRILFKPSMKPSALGSVSPSSPMLPRAWDRRRGSEPFPAFSRNTNGARLGLGRPRRDAVITADLSGSRSPCMSPIMQRRGKSRSICEATLAETFREQRFVKDMEEEERLDKPWNAWIAVRKESIQATSLPTTHEAAFSESTRRPTIHEAPVSENTRRMTFQQWLSEKELNHLRSLFATAQEAAKTNEKQARLMKGKTFEEWVEDKRKEIEREREKEREIEQQQKEEEDKKDRRRKMSQQKYDRWLMQKDLGALNADEKKVQQAKQKLEVMKKKWEEQDEKKKNSRHMVSRTRSLPVEGLPIPSASINKHRFGSLQNEHNK